MIRSLRCACGLLAVIAPLASCTPTPTYRDVAATAQLAGCWPDSYPTPPPVTVTPHGSGPTALPTTTPFPRCPPAQSTTPLPWPTPLPTQPPHPTEDGRPWQGGSDTQTVLQLPGTLYGLDLAVHPTAGWPVVGVTQRAWGTPLHAYVRVYSPATQTWGTARQVDTGRSSLGSDRFASLALGVTGDGTVYAAWGASDRAGAGGAAPPALWASTSRDGGATWSTPVPIAHHCWTVLDMATSAGGWVVVLANCYARSGAALRSQATLLVKSPDGDWGPPEVVPVQALFGAVVVAGDGADARAVALTAPYQAPQQRVLHLLTRHLADRGPWDVTARTVPLGAESERAAPWHIRGLAFAWPRADGRMGHGVLFTWATVTRAALFALVSSDGGQTWGAIESIQQRPGDPAQIGAQAWVAPAIDPPTGRLLALWPCCPMPDDPAGAATHYAAWRALAGAGWHTLTQPLITDARASGILAAAQAANSRTLWLAWIEGGQQVQVRSAALDTLVPDVATAPRDVGTGAQP